MPQWPEWENELKLGGLQAPRVGNSVRLYSRGGHEFTKTFARIAGQVEKIKSDSFVLDGETVVVKERGEGVTAEELGDYSHAGLADAIGERNRTCDLRLSSHTGLYDRRKHGR